MEVISTTVTRNQESSNSVFAADCAGIWAPSHKVVFAIQLHSFFSNGLIASYVCMPFSHFQGQSSTTDCCNACMSQASQLSAEENNLKATINMKSIKIIVSYG